MGIVPVLIMITLALVAFPLSHWKGVYRAQETGPPRFVPYQNWKDRLSTWAILFRHGMHFHLPFYLTFFFSHLTLVETIVYGLFAFIWAMFFHYTYNKLDASDPKRGLPYATLSASA